MSGNKPVHPISSIFLDQDLITEDAAKAGKNEFLFTFNRDVWTTETSRISVSNFSIPYSWFNISAENKNNQFYYVWFDGSTGGPGGPPAAAAGRGWSIVEFPSNGTTLSYNVANGIPHAISASQQSLTAFTLIALAGTANGFSSTGGIVYVTSMANGIVQLQYSSWMNVPMVGDVFILTNQGPPGSLVDNGGLISSQNNDVLQHFANPTWAAGHGGTVIPVTVPDGYYSLAILNAYLQFVMQQNGHYLVDPNGNYVYYLEFVTNPNNYRLEIHSWSLPTVAAWNTMQANGWTNPGGVYNPNGITFTTDGGHGYINGTSYVTPKIIFWDSTSKYNLFAGTSTTTTFTYFGYTVTSAPAASNVPSNNTVMFYWQSAPSALLPSAINGIGNVRVIPDLLTNNPPAPTFTYIKNLTIPAELSPVLTPVHVVCLSCNKVDNPLRSTPQHQVSTFVITSQNISVEFGKDITNSNFFTTWIPLLANQNFQQMKFTLLDQEGNPLFLQDPDISIELLITDLRYN